MESSRTGPGGRCAVSWAPGWYGWDVDSEDAAAWGPFSASEDAKGHPDVFAPDDAEVRVFYISVSDTPRHKDWANDARQSDIWLDGPDSEAARAARGCVDKSDWLECPCCERPAFAPLPAVHMDGTPSPCGCPTHWSVYDDEECEVAFTHDDEDRSCTVCPPREPDPAHTPAVRRVVAYDGGDGLVEDIDVAYLDRAIAIMCDHSESSRRMHRRMWHMSNAECDAATALIQDRLASYLRHRDEKAGHR